MTKSTRPITLLIVAILALSVLVSAGPALTALVQAAVPLVIVGGVVAVLVRVVFVHTRRW
jgi:hypothetical protein